MPWPWPVPNAVRSLARLPRWHQPLVTSEIHRHELEVSQQGLHPGVGVPTGATHRCRSPNRRYTQVLESQQRLHTSVGAPTAATHRCWSPNRGYTQVLEPQPRLHTGVGVPTAATNRWLESQPRLHTGVGVWMLLSAPNALAQRKSFVECVTWKYLTRFS